MRNRTEFLFKCADDAYYNWKTDTGRDTEVIRLLNRLPREKITPLALYVAKISDENLPKLFPQYDWDLYEKSKRDIIGRRADRDMRVLRLIGTRDADLARELSSFQDARLHEMAYDEIKQYTERKRTAPYDEHSVNYYQLKECSCDFYTSRDWAACDAIKDKHPILFRDTRAHVMHGHYANLMRHPKFDARYALDNPNPHWDYTIISASTAITLEHVQDNLHLPWDWVYMSTNPNITCEFVIRHLDKPWFIPRLLTNAYKQNSIALGRSRARDLARWRELRSVCGEFITPGKDDNISRIIESYVEG